MISETLGLRRASEAVAAGERSRAYLLVVENGSSRVFELPRSGAVVIGRAPECELSLPDKSVSRQHAIIRIEPGAARVADVESRNGTRVNGEPLAAPRLLGHGDVIAVGEVVLVYHADGDVAPLDPLDDRAWRRRLVEELDRAVEYGRPCVIVALAGVDADAQSDAIPRLRAALRRIDVLGTGGDGLILVLCPETRPDVAADAARACLDALIPVVATARAGFASCPADACDADSLLYVARAAARAATPGTAASASATTHEIVLGARSVLLADAAMIGQYRLIERLAAAGMPVLITGETGVGKENAAYAVHWWSSRREGPFVAIDCASLPESLIESELFGHERGAFTGATVAKVGRIEAAAGGTVFLDEIGELSSPVQAKLLRVLEERKLTRLGDVRERSVDVRVVAATNRNLADEVAAGRFRQDLYFRLGATVYLPPLRLRRAEIPVLARMFLAQACARLGRPPLEITPAAMQGLLTHTWPGNVRELRNVMEFAAAAVEDDRVEPSDLADRLGGAQPRISQPMAVAAAPADALLTPASGDASRFRPIEDEKRELERLRMKEALDVAGGVKTKAAQLIGMPIRTFTMKMKQYGLKS